MDIFYLIGMAPNGLCLEDLQALFPSTSDIRGLLKKLEETSLITSSSDTYKVQNFIIHYVKSKLTEASKTKLNRMLASFYSSRLIDVKQLYSNNSIEHTELEKTLLKYSKNIEHALE